jgi:hypothetical protein
MGKSASLGLLLLLSALVAACGATSMPAPEPVALESATASPAQAAGPPVLPNLLVEAQGEVWLRRVGWSEFLPAGFGVAVQPGDLLRIPEGSVASVFCGDETLWESGPKALPTDDLEHTAPCQTGRPPRPWSDVAALRGEQGAQIPYVVWPRNTALLSDRPQLQWNALPGVDSYTVALISDDGQERPPVTADGGELAWPVGWPPLEQRATYVLVVEGDGARSDEGNEQHAGLGFWLLDRAEAEQVRALESRLRGQSLGPSAADLLVAELYLGRDLRAEATGLLEGLSASAGSAPVWLALGQAYLEAGLTAEARAALDRAVVVAGETGQQQVEAEALVGLGLAARLEDDGATAETHLQAARALYEQIGDQAGLEQLDQLLSD